MLKLHSQLIRNYLLFPWTNYYDLNCYVLVSSRPFHKYIIHLLAWNTEGVISHKQISSIFRISSSSIDMNMNVISFFTWNPAPVLRGSLPTHPTTFHPPILHIQAG